jgi:hypothetical protein
MVGKEEEEEEEVGEGVEEEVGEGAEEEVGEGVAEEVGAGAEEEEENEEKLEEHDEELDEMGSFTNLSTSLLVSSFGYVVRDDSDKSLGSEKNILRCSASLPAYVKAYTNAMFDPSTEKIV